MSAETASSALEEAVAPVLDRFDLVLEEITVRHRSGTAHVTLVVDLPEEQLGSADLDTVADASTAISELLDTDAALLGPGPSLLEVTTPGIDRPLREARHFRRARGRLVDLPAVQGERPERARILAVDGDTVVLRREPGTDDRGRPRRLPEGTGVRLELPVAEAAGARVVIEFDPPADLAALLEQAQAEIDGGSETTTAPKEN